MPEPVAWTFPSVHLRSELSDDFHERLFQNVGPSAELVAPLRRPDRKGSQLPGNPTSWHRTQQFHKPRKSILKSLFHYLSLARQIQMATREKGERSDSEKNELMIAEVSLSAEMGLYDQAKPEKYAQEQYRSVIPELVGAMNPGLGYSGN